MRLSINSASWLEDLRSALTDVGYAIIEGVLAPDLLAECRSRLYSAQAAITADIGAAKLRAAGEIGVLRVMMKFEPFFLRFLELPPLLSIVDATVGPTAILHLQNGFILPSFPQGSSPETFQNNFHRDFPRYLNGYVASVNVFFAIDEFTAENGGTLVVPGTHQRAEAPPVGYMDRQALSVECPAGSALVFDSTLWHASGRNSSGRDRLAINHQFTRSFFKQQIDYVRALGEEAIAALPERSKQLLGYYTRVPTSLQDYYKPEAERLYRKGQG